MAYQNRRQYEVEMTWHDAIRSCRILEVQDAAGLPEGTRYLKADDFGMSRNYLTATDEDAIRLFLSEHNYTVRKIVRTF
jgi:hypothetical protein